MTAPQGFINVMSVILEHWRIVTCTLLHIKCATSCCHFIITLPENDHNANTDINYFAKYVCSPPPLPHSYFLWCAIIILVHYLKIQVVEKILKNQIWFVVMWILLCTYYYLWNDLPCQRVTINYFAKYVFSLFSLSLSLSL